MIWTIVDDVATLTEALEIAPPVIAGVVIEVRRCEYYAGLSYLRRLYKIGPPCTPTPRVPPSVAGGIEPTPIGQTANSPSMRATASLTNPSGALKAHAPADLRPIAWIYSPHFKFDWHSHTHLC
jgi:hypothetical protein